MEILEPRLILVPVDFSPQAAHALHYAAALGRRFQSHLLVIHADTFVPAADFTIVAAAPFEVPRAQLIEAARERLARFASANVGEGVAYDTRVVIGTPAFSVTELVRQTGANLIVMGTHGRTGLRRLLIGSVTESVMRTASVPVIAVHESTAGAEQMRVIAGRNGATAEDQLAAGLAGLLANVDDARYVQIPEDAGILDTARKEGADLIALGIRGSRGLSDLLFGTDVEQVVQHSVCPVLTVNPHAAALLEQNAKASRQTTMEPALTTRA